MKYVIMALTLLLCFNVTAKTLIVQVEAYNGDYSVKSLQVIDRPLRQTSPRVVESGAILYELLDRNGAVILEGIVADPFTLAAEFHSTRDYEIEGDLLKNRSGSFVIRVPYDEAMESLRLSQYDSADDLGMVRSSHAHSGAVHSVNKDRVLEQKPVAEFKIEKQY